MSDPASRAGLPTSPPVPVRPSVLVIDDEAGVRESIAAALEPEYRVEALDSAEAGLAVLQKRAFDVVLCDLRLPGMDGLTFLERVLADDPASVAVAITGYASVETAVRALKHGVFDYLGKPFTPDELRKVVSQGLQVRRLRRENDALRNVAGAAGPGAMFLGESAAMRRLYATVEQVAGTDAPVFITGESGSGKEVLARLIHARSTRKGKPFVAVNCAMFSESLMVSEVFGHTKGAFTGAQAERRGCIELADGGTLLFDEMAELKPDLQARLLRVLEDETVTRLGSERAITVDVRYLAATQRRPDDLIRAGLLREDLFFRMGVVTIDIPPLRERTEDLPGLAEHLLRGLRGELKKDVGAVEPAALDALKRHAWPGNVRELRNVLERAAIFARPGETIGIRHLPPVFHDNQAADEFALAPGRLVTLKELEQRYVKHVMDACGGSRGKAAKVLGVSQSTLWRWEQGERDDGPPPASSGGEA